MLYLGIPWQHCAGRKGGRGGGKGTPPRTKETAGEGEGGRGIIYKKYVKNGSRL